MYRPRDPSPSRPVSRAFRAIPLLLAVLAGCDREAPTLAGLVDGQPFEAAWSEWEVGSGCVIERELLESGPAQCPEARARLREDRELFLAGARALGADTDGERGRALWDLLWLEAGLEPTSAILALGDRARARGSADDYNDLAVAHYVAARSSGRPGRLLVALEAVETALEIEPGHRAAEFNRELFLRRLFLSTAVNPATSDGVAAAWEALRSETLPALAAATESSELAPLAARAHEQAARAGSPGMVASMSRVAEIVGSGEAARIAAVQNALREHVLGVEAYERFEIGTARAHLDRAESALRRLDIPFALWSRYYLILCDYQALEYDAAYRALEALRSPAERAGLHYLVARTLHVRSLLHQIAGEPFAALALSRAELDTMRATGSRVALASPHLDLARLLRQLGERDEAWGFLYRSLEIAAATPPLQRYGIWREASEAAMATGASAVAGHFVRAWVELTRAHENAAFRSGGFRQAARYYSDSGDHAAAERALAEATGAAEAIPDPAVRELVSMNVELERAAMASDDERAQAKRLRQLAAYHARQPDLARELRLDTLRLRFLRDVDPDDELAAIARRAADRTAGAVRAITDPVLRAQYVLGMRELFEEVWRAQLAAGASVPEMLATWEALQASRWSDRVPEAEVAGSLATFLDPPSGQPRRSFLMLAGLEDELVRLTVDSSGAKVERLPMARAELLDRIARLRQALARGDAQRTRELGTVVGELLLPPATGAGESDTLVVAADGWLQGVPFAALRVPGTRRYLIEDRAVVLVPSVVEYTRSRQRLAGLRAAPRGPTLLVAQPEAFARPVPLPALPDATAELQLIRQHRPDARVLSAGNATRDAILSALRGAETLHFAGHAISNSEAPQLSWLAVRGADAGEAEPLRASDLARAPMPRLELVVLSACRTVGATGDSPGLIGIARAFRLAGVPSVIGSLWEVDDRAVADMFQAFHARHASGEGPAQALRAAQLSQLRRHPDSTTWAAFQLLGADG